jgi:hypothetical protein
VPKCRFGSLAAAAAEICGVRFAPEKLPRHSLTGVSAMGQKQTKCIAAENILFDHLVSSDKETGWHRKAECLRGPKIDDEAVDSWLLKWQIARFLAA